MGAPRIEKADLDPVVSTHPGNRALLAALEGAREPQALLCVLGRYVQFNSAFGAGVANLAGEIAARQDLFRDPAEPVRLLSDRAAEVAADFFYAAIDEFDDRLTPWRDTHRTLAQATLKAAAAHLGFAPADLDRIVTLEGAVREGLEQVWRGYGVGTRLEDRRLFEAMGFHTGSEVLADQEFTLIDRFLRERHGGLVRALEAARVELQGQKHDAYYWIRIHTGVEAEHFDAALKGANKALAYYAGAGDAEAVKGWILGGLARFAEVQGGFMAHLGDA
jgi:hypothetical protein